MPDEESSIPERRERRRLAIVERTLDAAEPRFAKKGYAGTKVAVICAEARGDSCEPIPAANPRDEEEGP